MLDLGNAVNRKAVPENENPYKEIDIDEEIPKFNKQKEENGLPLNLATSLKVLSPKQMLQRLPITLAQVQTGNISKNLLNEIRQIIYFLYRAKEVTKKVYNNIIN